MPLVNSDRSVSIAIVGSGGAGVMTTGELLFDAAAKQGWYGTLTRTLGPQIRGGEVVAMVRLAPEPVYGPTDEFDVILAIDWKNAERFVAEIPLRPDSLVIADERAGELPEMIAASGARSVTLPIVATAKTLERGRPNMLALGMLAEMLELPEGPIAEKLEAKLGAKGEDVVLSGLTAVAAGRKLVADIPGIASADIPRPEPGERWVITGNEAAGLGAITAGIRFVAAYPITPATEVLEWLAPALPKVGGTLVQAEDELSSINMVIGGSFGGVPSLTATSGPGLALMVESLGLAVAAEVPLVVIDVMRGGPSTGIPTKAEQSDLNIAVYGLHGDAPHVVMAPLSVEDCYFTLQWGVHLAESIQVPVIALSDQYIGQARAAIDRPADPGFRAGRELLKEAPANYERYADTDTGISPMAVPGMPGGQYTADGLTHGPTGIPSTSTEHHAGQLDKRLRKLTGFDYGEHWAELEGEGELALITWGSTTGAAREALRRLRADGLEARLIAVRLIAPFREEQMAAALKGVGRALVVEQNHSAQFYVYLKAHCDLPADTQVFNRPGPLVIRPDEIVSRIKAWSRA